MKLKILHVINSMQPGGAESLLANSLAPGGLQEHTDNWLVYFKGDSHLLERMDKRVNIINLKYKNYLGLPKLLWQLRKIIRENNIDIVHSHLNPAGVYTHLVCPNKVKQVHTLHTTYSMDKETSPFMLWIEKRFFLLSKKCNCIFLSDYSKTDFLKAIPYKGKSFILNNFVPDFFFENREQVKEHNKDIYKLVAIGRLSDVKNFGYLLAVFDYLKGKPVELDIYGAGDKTAYDKEIARTGVNVRMMGESREIATRLMEYDAFIMPSKFEGFPLSVFEAMASGLPLLLSDIPPLKSIVKDHAIYFPLNDAKTVAGIIEKLYKGEFDTETQVNHAKMYAHQTVRKEKYIENLMRIYKQLNQQYVS